MKLRVVTLGSVAVYAGGDDELLRTVSQPKRLGLLAFLGCKEVTRRDTVLGIFWPDLDQRHARDALSRAVHYLRRRIGHDAIRSIGRDGLMLGEDVWMDLRAFRDAIHGNRLREALEFYGGEFLVGLHVGAGREFDQWLEVERRHAHVMAEDAAWSLTEEAVAEGDLHGAVGWARHGAELSPGNERAACRLAELLAEEGSRAEAVQGLDDFVTRMREDFDLEPSPEVFELTRRLRSGNRHH